MQRTERPVARGRPPTITQERIVNAGIDIGLPSITFVGVAAALGVSHMALYKHVPSLEALKQMVAEAIFSRWQIPQVGRDSPAQLLDYLIAFSASAQALVKNHPGLTPYVIRRLAATQPMLDKIDEHQSLMARHYGIDKAQARWLLATVAFHCIAVADTVYSVAGQGAATDDERADEVIEMEAEFTEGMRALITGALAMMGEGETQARV